MNRPRSALRNPLIRRIWRHKTVAIMLRSSLPEYVMASSRRGTSQPIILRYPEDELMESGEGTREPNIESTITKQDEIPGAEAYESTTRQPVDTTKPIPASETTIGQPSATIPGEIAFPVFTGQPTQPAVPAQAQEAKSPKGRRVPAILRKLQEILNPPKIIRAPSGDLSQKITPPSYPPPSTGREPEVRASSTPQTMVQAGTMGAGEINAGTQQAPEIIQTSPATIPKAHVVVPLPPIQPVKRETQNVQRVASTQESIRGLPSAVSPTTSSEDLTWRRLQTILRKHEEKETAEKKQPSPTPGPVKEQLPPPAIQASSSQKTGLEIPPPLISETPGLKTTYPSQVKAPLPGSEKARLLTPLEPTSPTEPTSPIEPTATRSLSSVSVGEVSGQQPAKLPVELPKPSPQSLPSIKKSDDTQIYTEGEHEPNYFTPTEPEETQTMPLPLEAAWPVQRKEISPPISQPTVAQPSSGSSLTSYTPLPPSDEEHIREVVQKAKTGQPTDSSVEVILPRSPRPQSMQKAVTPNLPQAPSPQVEQTISTQKELEEQPLGEESIQKGEITPLQETPLHTAPPVSQTTYGPQAIPILQAAAKQLIPTEIGPLPSDLWHLLGQTPPEQSAGEIPPVQQTSEMPLEQPTSEMPLEQPTSEMLPEQPTSEMLPEQPTSEMLPEQPAGEIPPVQPAGEITPETTSTAANIPTIIQETPYLVSPEPEAITADHGTDKQILTKPPRKQAMTDTPSVTMPTSPADTSQISVTIPDHVNQMIMQEIAKAEKPSIPAGSQPVEFPQPVIQRVPEDTQTTTPESTTSSGGEETSQQTPTLSDEDLDKLAHQVYKEIRQKLSIERERARGRM